MKSCIDEYTDKALNSLKGYLNKYAFDNNMEVNSFGEKYWNGEYSDIQKEDLCRRYEYLYPKFIADLLIDEDEDKYEGELEVLDDAVDDMEELADNDDLNGIHTLFLSLSKRYGMVNEFKKFLADKLKTFQLKTVPTWAYQNYQGVIPKREWLIHFSNDAREIFDHGKFTNGSDLENLSVTNGENNGDYAFAYHVDSLFLSPLQGSVPPTNMTSYGSAYGKEAIMFQASAIKTYHHGDNEYQAIFNKNSASNLVYLQNNGDFWFITDNTTNRIIIRKKNIYEIVEWVINNFHQYKNKITSNMRRNRINITESRLHSIIDDTIHDVLSEGRNRFNTPRRNNSLTLNETISRVVKNVLRESVMINEAKDEELGYWLMGLLADNGAALLELGKTGKKGKDGEEKISLDKIKYKIVKRIKVSKVANIQKLRYIGGVDGYSNYNGILNAPDMDTLMKIIAQIGLALTGNGLQGTGIMKRWNDGTGGNVSKPAPSKPRRLKKL